MPDAVVDADEGEGPKERERAGGDRDGLEGRAHAGAGCEADAGDVGDANAGLLEGLLDQADDVGTVVKRGVFGEEAFTGR